MAGPLTDADYQTMGFPWRFFAERKDFNRRLHLFFMKEDGDKKLWPWALRPLDGANPFYPMATISGMEDTANILSIAEGQQLFDAMWDAGMRPTRR